MRSTWPLKEGGEDSQGKKRQRWWSCSFACIDKMHSVSPPFGIFLSLWIHSVYNQDPTFVLCLVHLVAELCFMNSDIVPCNKVLCFKNIWFGSISVIAIAYPLNCKNGWRPKSELLLCNLVWSQKSKFRYGQTLIKECQKQD